MRNLMLASVMLALGAFSLHGALAQDTKQGGEGEVEVTGTVTEVNDDTHTITIDGTDYKISGAAGTAVMPSVGDKVSLFYEEQDGQNMVTRIGQPQ